jgi:hypothetical protein
VASVVIARELVGPFIATGSAAAGSCAAALAGRTGGGAKS